MVLVKKITCLPSRIHTPTVPSASLVNDGIVERSRFYLLMTLV